MNVDQMLVLLERIEEIKVARLQPGDVVVLRSAVPVSSYIRERLNALAGDLFPGHRCLVLDAGVTVEVVRSCES